MAQIGISEEVSEDDGIEQSRRPKGHMTAEYYIQQVVGTPESGSETDSDLEITDVVAKPVNDKKRKWEDTGTKVTWSSEDEYIFPKPKTKREKAAKRVGTAHKKTVAAGKKAGKAEKKPEKEKKERVWGDASSDEEHGVDIPKYLTDRRANLDDRYEKLGQAGLRLPPRYDDLNTELLGCMSLENLEERPQLERIQPSRKYEDIDLPDSLGVIPASIAQYLRDYQIKGVEFLHGLFVHQRGGLLADDMGLGKTIQVASFLTVAFGKTGDERDRKRMRAIRRAGGGRWYPRVLIVCPSSLMQNWRNELDRWGWWHIEQYHGNNKEESLKTVKTGRAEILITTYTTYTMNTEVLNQIEWDCVVADECHVLKENSSRNTKAMGQVNALCRIGLTGTAIQNKYEELWTLLNWTNPGSLGPKATWKNAISEPLRIGQSHDATAYQLKQARTIAKQLVENLLPSFFLRRMKSLIAHQLPKKSDTVVFCPLTDTQREAYELFLESDYVLSVKTANDDCDCGSNLTRGGCCHKSLYGTDQRWKAGVFPIMSTLQKLSNHLALLIPKTEDSHDKQSRDLENLQMMVQDRWEELYQNRDSLANMVNSDFCGKWNILKKLLKHWYESGDKVLIFSHSVKLLRMLEHLFKNTSYNLSFLSGSMPMEERQITVDDFNSDPNQFVFLISTKAGGVGLNITSANKVVIFDPNWNPAYDLQAQDRAYRIGQQRDVDVFRLISSGTIEEIIYARQIYKQQQANIGYTASTERRYFKGIQDHPDQKGEIFGLGNMFSFNADNILLRDIVNKTNVAEAKKGVTMLELDIDILDLDDDDPFKPANNDDENGAMSQLAALLTGDKKAKKKKISKRDPIQEILASAGVEYTHENSEVVGSSKVEAQLSRRAEETADITSVGIERAFDDSQSMDQTGSIKYLYHPPQDVMRRQFCTMAKTFDFESPVEFALIVEGWSQEKRRNALDRFYMKRRERIAELKGTTAEPDVLSEDDDGELLT